MIRRFQASFGRVESEVPVMFSTSEDNRRWSPSRPAVQRARAVSTGDASASSSRHIPDSIKREVFVRDGGRC
jgi:hypothetical protein